ATLGCEECNRFAVQNGGVVGSQGALRDPGLCCITAPRELSLGEALYLGSLFDLFHSLGHTSPFPPRVLTRGSTALWLPRSKASCWADAASLLVTTTAVPLLSAATRIPMPTLSAA